MSKRHTDTDTDTQTDHATRSIAIACDAAKKLKDTTKRFDALTIQDKLGPIVLSYKNARCRD